MNPITKMTEIHRSELANSGAPFPYFGGKSWIADEVWSRLGNVPNYVEPFAGSLAVLLARPHEPKTETVNDADGMISNFWRAVRYEPESVAEWADWPVNEVDLHARHYWLVTEGIARLQTILGDPDAFDAKIAGWWLWGICQWIGSGWCSGEGPWAYVEGEGWVKRDAGRGINRALPHLSWRGHGHQLETPASEWRGHGHQPETPASGRRGQGPVHPANDAGTGSSTP